MINIYITLLFYYPDFKLISRNIAWHVVITDIIIATKLEALLRKFKKGRLRSCIARQSRYLAAAGHTCPERAKQPSAARGVGAGSIGGSPFLLPSLSFFPSLFSSLSCAGVTARLRRSAIGEDRVGGRDRRDGSAALPSHRPWWGTVRPAGETPSGRGGGEG